MAGLLVNVQLEILIVIEEASPLFENGQMERIALFQHVEIVAASDLRLDLDLLSTHFRPPHRQSVTPAICH